MNSETTPAPAPEKQKHNKLEMPQQFKLLDWCRQNEDKVKTLPDPQLAQIAEAELGFKITTPNLASVRQAAGIEKLKPTAPPTVEERLERIEKTLGTFITWSQRELGESGALALLTLLATNPAVPPPPPKLTPEDKLATIALDALGLPGLENPPQS